jgi:CheY-like chemotaxis protein
LAFAKEGIHMAHKILVVDDESDVRKYLETLLKTGGYDVVMASDGDEAMKIIEQDPPDLISLDIMMPKETGVRFYRKIKKKDSLKDIPIVVVSGMAGRHLAVPEPNAIFEKPVDRDEYLKTIKSLLE